MSTSPYNEAGNLMTKIMKQKKSIKSVAFANQKMSCSKASYATVCNTIANKPNIDKILGYQSGKLRKDLEVDKTRNIGLLYVLLSELLFGKYQSIRGGGQLKRKIVQHEKALRETKAAVVKMDLIKNQSTIVFPRYVRVNNLKCSLEEVAKELRHEMNLRGLSNEKIFLDDCVPDLMVLNPNLSLPWHDLDIVKEGKVILQDKSSCFSALALVNGNETRISGDIIDACAAPGNKTCHVAALLYKQISTTNPPKTVQTVFGFDRSSSRVKILNDRMATLAPSVVSMDSSKKKKQKFPIEISPIHQDFLQVDSNDSRFTNVRAILLDPSCSGSGIVNTPDRLADKTIDNDRNRLKSLSSFQLVALKHAMSFPNVERIVYSTCSIHKEENEDVVAVALQESNAMINDKSLHWKLVSPTSLSTWNRRGLKHSLLTEDESKCLIRVDGLEGDDTNGFFVSYFERGTMPQTTKSTNAPSINLVEGIDSIYSGEFTPKEQNDIETSTPMKKMEQLNSPVQSHLNVNEGEGGNAIPQKTATKVMSKKIEKRMNWKRKQAELKKRRLQKKGK